MIALIIALALAAAVLSTGLYGAWKIVHRRRPDAITNPALHGLEYEEVQFRAVDGLALNGWFIPSEGSQRAVVFCHGYGGSMDPDIQYAPAFHRQGYNVLMFDFRGHGRSEGRWITMGCLERLDLLAAVDYMVGRGFPRLGVLGFSMGGAVAIMGAPHREAVRAVVADGSFASLVRTVETGARNKGLPAPIGAAFAWLSLVIASALTGCRMWRVAPERWVSRISPRALFLIHGADDRYATVAEVQAMYQAAGEPKEVWIQPGVGHREVDVGRPDEYRARVLGFFDRYLVE